MPQHKSCKKRMKTAKIANEENRAGKSTMKNVVRKVLSAKTKSEAEPLLRTAVATLDKVAQKGIIHRNKAAHAKSRLDLYVNKLS
ncbi:MAG: 30S ribosomal protein S20 [bacterium]|nr:30S ribosomal protein S20 [bacterium]